MDPWAMPKKVKLADVNFNAETLDYFTPEIAKRFCAIPISVNLEEYSDLVIEVAVVDSCDLHVVDGITLYLSEKFPNGYVRIIFSHASKEDLLEYIEKHYSTAREEYEKIVKDMEDKEPYLGIDRGF